MPFWLLAINDSLHGFIRTPEYWWHPVLSAAGRFTQKHSLRMEVLRDNWLWSLTPGWFSEPRAMHLKMSGCYHFPIPSNYQAAERVIKTTSYTALYHKWCSSCTVGFLLANTKEGLLLRGRAHAFQCLASSGKARKESCLLPWINAAGKYC